MIESKELEVKRLLCELNDESSRKYMKNYFSDREQRVRSKRLLSELNDESSRKYMKNYFSDREQRVRSQTFII